MAYNRARFSPDDRIIRFHIDPFVDEDKTIASVHEGLLRASAPCFAGMIYAGQQEDHITHIEVVDEDSMWNQMNLYVSWLYNPGTAVVQEGRSITITDLLWVYKLGHKIDNSAFMDAVIDAVVDVLESPEAKDNFLEAFLHESFGLPLGSKLMSVFVEWLVFGCETGVRQKELEKFSMSYTKSAEFLREVALAQGRAIDRGLPVSKQDAAYHRDRCSFHMHTAKGLPCYKEG